MKIVIALGGNALEDKNNPTLERQLQVIRETSKHIVDVIEEGHDLIIVHGNGPQVGRLLIQSHCAREHTPQIALDVADAMTEGAIGYQVQQSLNVSLRERNIKRNVVTLITQIVVDEADEAFKNPTKPIGPFYTQGEISTLVKSTGNVYKKDNNKGYRQVVASPKPKDIVELAIIKKLFKDKDILICCGGGGIPVVKKDNLHFKGVPAVIDKDLAAEKLAEDLGADMLLILTDVPKVCVNYNKSNEKQLDSLTLTQAKNYIKEGQFAEGSMLPKVQACCKFIAFNENARAVITSLENIVEAIKGDTGTTFLK